MTYTVQELKANLKHHSDSTLVEIKDVDDEEFAIVDFRFENDKLTIIIGTKEDEEEGHGE